MQRQVIDIKTNSSVSTLELLPQVFSEKYNESIIHQIVTAFRAGGRAGTKAQKTRAEVRGGGKKPWRQKGTGRARAGSSRGPIWRKGGVTFAAKPRDFSQKVNKKMYRAAMVSILSELMRQDRIIIIDKLELSAPKTKEMVKVVAELEIESALFILEGIDRDVFLAARNLYMVDVITVREVNPYGLIKAKKIVITKEALKLLEGQLA